MSPGLIRESRHVQSLLLLRPLGSESELNGIQMIFAPLNSPETPQFADVIRQVCLLGPASGLWLVTVVLVVYLLCS